MQFLPTSTLALEGMIWMVDYTWQKYFMFSIQILVKIC